MSDLYSKTLNDFLEEARGSAPTPGGGSVSAVAGTQAAAMVHMVIALTQGKKGYEEHAGLLEELSAANGKTMDELKRLTQGDIDAFNALMDVWKTKAKTDEEKAAKKKTMAAATEQATRVPLAIGAACLEVLQQAQQVAPIGNTHAISDAGVGILLAEAALQSALLSVDINLPNIKDEDLAKSLADERDGLIAEAKKIKDEALAVVKGRLG